MIYDSRMKMNLYNYVPNTHSRADIIDAMHKNLGISKSKNITKFSFSINEPYEEEIIGQGPYSDGYETVTSVAPPTTTKKKSTTTNKSTTTETKQEATTTTEPETPKNDTQPVEPDDPVTPPSGGEEGGTDSGSSTDNP